MNYLEGEKSEVFESHKAKVIENINKSKSMGMNKITAILAIDDEDEIIQGALINWLIKEGYRISLIKEDYNIDKLQDEDKQIFITNVNGEDIKFYLRL